MTRRETVIVIVAAAAVVLTAVPTLAPMFWSGVVARPESSAAERGAKLAVAEGCVGCHGPGGTGGVKNPGSDDKEVPAFVGGVPMMYADDDAQLHHWILTGKRNDEPDEGTDDPLLQMPAFKDRLSAAQVDDLVAWIDALSPPGAPPDGPAKRGWELAQDQGCFGCHGPTGQGGIADPGSFKGYVPGWFGADLRELAASDDEIREWIETGSSKRMEAKPGAKHFFDAQVIGMPAYGKRLSKDQVGDLVALVKWVNDGAKAVTPTKK